MANFYCCRRCGRRYERLEDCTPHHFTPGGSGPCGGVIFNVNNGPGQTCGPYVNLGPGQAPQGSGAGPQQTWRDRPPLL